MDGMDPPVQVVELAPAVCTRCACVSVLTQYAPVLQSPPCLGVGHAVCKCCQQQGCGSHSHHRRCWCRCRCWCRRCGCGSRSEVSPSLGCRAHGAYEDHQSTSGVEEPRCRGGNPGIQLVQCMPCTATILTGGSTTQTAEAGDYSGVRALLHMLQHPFDDEVGALHGCTVARLHGGIYASSGHTRRLLTPLRCSMQRCLRNCAVTSSWSTPSNRSLLLQKTFSSR